MFWYNNPSILYDSNYLLDIFPHGNYTTELKLNSIMRLSIYYVLIMGILKYKTIKQDILLIPLIVGIITILINKHYRNDNTDLHNLKRMEEIKNNGLIKEECRLPTKENPFMNPNVTDMGKETLPHCETNPGVKELTEGYFHEDIFKDTNDIFNKHNSQRQFFTMPLNGTVPDQGKFAEWLYKVPDTCKEGNSENCMNAGRWNASPAPSGGGGAE